MSYSPYEIGDPVKIKGHHGVTGIIAGFGQARNSIMVIVELDSPNWLEGREMFISLLAVHPDNLEHLGE